MNRPRRRWLPAMMVLTLLSAQAAHASDWPGWRGPTGLGYCAEKDLPLTWNGKTGENIVWKAPLAGTTGHSSPIVWGERVFVTTATKQTRDEEARKEIPEHHLVCFQTSDGKLLWRTPIPQGKEFAGYAIYASPTPVTDGKTVYVWFGSAVVAAVDFNGKLLWRHERPGPFNLNPGITSSPILYRDTLILISDQGRDNGFLQGLDTKTGAVKWEKKRKGVGACNATPVLVQVKGKPQMIVAASNALQGLDPESGAPIWWCKGWGFGSSPVFSGNLIYADRGGNEPAQAVELGGAGDVTKTHVKWKNDKVPGDYSSPVISGDFIYRVQAEGIIQCFRLSTGEKLYTERLENVSKLASPIATADGRVYFASAGVSYVIEAGPTLKVLATNRIGQGSSGNNGGSPAVANGRLYVRNFEFLYCIGDKKSDK
jgi:outer membrane protein assembly factor BamB